MSKNAVRVLVTGAAGQIGYSLVPMIARGAMLGPDQPVILHMLDIEPAAEALNGVKMELIDAAFPLLNDVIATTDVVEACTGVDIAVMVGGFPRKEGMERKDVMSKNVSIYKAQASALEKHANTTARLRTEFIKTVQQRGAAIIKARKLSSALSAASSACDHIRDWVLGTPKGTWVSMGVYSDGSYGIPSGLIYSFPVTCEKGEWSIVQGLKIDEFSRTKMDDTANELIEEKSLAYSCLN
ncbi:hypothetical protein MKX01_004476 [Papaver californicum]|nr:hypothetical protein MKX01_004476 [Papaver californicum]